MAKAVLIAGWEDAPWIPEGKQKDILASTPPHLVDAVSKGIPTAGVGNVYPFLWEDITCDPIEIPAHWKRWYALDVGWNFTAALWAAKDPNTSDIYIYKEYKESKKEPVIHASAIMGADPWIPGCIDPAADGRASDDGKQLLQTYVKSGLRLVKAKNNVESGIEVVWQLLSTGKCKIFKNLYQLRAELVTYARDQKGRIIKRNDHLADCYSADTEVLTANGWKFWPDVSMQDALATVSLETDQLEYQKPTELFCRDYSGPMVEIKNKSLDFLVTPNHRMVVYPRDKTAPTIKTANELSIWDKLKGTCAWEGEDFEAPHGLSQEDWARFLGWFVTEGHTTASPRCPGYGYQVTISQSERANPEHSKEIGELLDKFDIKWNRTKQGVFYCSNKELWTRLSPLGKCYDKYIPDEIKNARPEIIKHFLDAAVKGDGWTNPTSWIIATTSKRFADDLQEVILKSGDNSSIKVVKPKPYNIHGRTGDNVVDQYWVYKITTKNPLLRDYKNTPSFRTVDYEGKVYCASVPNSTLVVRRKNRVIIAGNCLRYLLNTQTIAISRIKATQNGYSSSREFNF